MKSDENLENISLKLSQCWMVKKSCAFIIIGLEWEKLVYISQISSSKANKINYSASNQSRLFPKEMIVSSHELGVFCHC